MRKNLLIYVLLSILLIGGVTWFFLQHRAQVHKEEQATILLEKIEEVKKLILVEGTFSEVYTYKQAENIFYDLFPVEKKVIVIVNAKASIAYDLEKVNFTIDKENKLVIINNIPKEEIIIVPKIEYYDIQQSQFYPLTEKDLTTINERAVSLIEKQVKASVLPYTAEQRLQEVLEQIIFTGENMGWKVIKD